MQQQQRQTPYQRNEQLEIILKEINSIILQKHNQETLDRVQETEFPPVFIFGCARSGTTLLYQWLASSGLFAYPNNMISRFYGNPVFGAYVYKALYELDVNDEIFPHKEKILFESDLGKTVGANAPHEFWYFWRRFFQFDEINKLSDEELGKVDTSIFKSELIAFEQVFKKPLLMKAMIMNWHIPFLYDLFPNALFIHIKREPYSNGMSLIKARKKFFNDETQWYSFKPPEFIELQYKKSLEQVAGQVFYTNKAIIEGLEELPKSSVYTIKYDVFCENTTPLIEWLSLKIGFKVNRNEIIKSFKLNNVDKFLTSEEEFLCFYNRFKLNVNGKR